MITDTFLNLCCAILTTDTEKFNDKALSDIHTVLTFYKDKDSGIPLPCKSKFDLTYTLSKLRVGGKTIDESLDNIKIAGQFRDIDSFVNALGRQETAVPESKIESALNQIKDRKKLTILLKDMPFIENFLEKFNTNSFSDLSEAIDSWDLLISKLYTRLSEEKRSESYTAIKSLDMLSDTYEPVLDQIEISYSGKNSITTGYEDLDSYMNGGFEPSRLYVFGGASGDGKSVLLLNFAKNAIGRKKAENPKKEIYIYVTLENLIDESLIRLYCNFAQKEIKQVIENYDTERIQIERVLKEWQEINNSILVMAYFPPTITSVADLLVYIDEIKNRYKDEGIVKGVYIDYLDLLMAGQKFDLHRLEMGQITIDLKVLAVRLQIPVVTVTQVNRSGYDHKENISLVHMSESIKKVEHSDFVAMIRSFLEAEENAKFLTKEGKLQISIGKNRSGPKNQTVTLDTYFSNFRIYGGEKTTHLEIRKPEQSALSTEDIMEDAVF